MVVVEEMVEDEAADHGVCGISCSGMTGVLRAGLGIRPGF